MPEDYEEYEEEAPMEAPQRPRRRAPPRSKSMDDSGSLAQMRASQNGESGGAPRPRRGGRRAPARTKSTDDMAAMTKMTRYARQKSKEDDNKVDSPEKGTAAAVAVAVESNQ